MLYRQSIMKHSLYHGVSKTSRKYNKGRSYIYFWLDRYDGTIESLACQSRKPLSHPNAHTAKELKLIADMKRRNPHLGMVELWCRMRDRGYTRSLGGLYRVLRKQGWFDFEKPKKKYIPKPYQQMTYPGERVQIDVKVVPSYCRVGDARETKLYQYTAIDEFSRLRYLAAYNEQSTYSSADFLAKAVAYYAKRGIKVECIRTDNGFEFTNRLSRSKRPSETLFEMIAASRGLKYSYIRPYTPRHNGKVERSHREDQKRFYSHHTFYSLKDFASQLATYLTRANNIPMRPLGYLSPIQYLINHSVQYV